MTGKEKFSNVINAIIRTARDVLPPGSCLALYGSRARGEAHALSDWDIHILVPGEERLPMQLTGDLEWAFSELGVDLEEDINAMIYSYSGWAKRSFLPFYKNVERDKIIIFSN